MALTTAPTNLTTTTLTQTHFQLNSISSKPIFTSPEQKKTSISASNNNNASATWSVDTWKSKKALQIPSYPNKEELDSVLNELTRFPPLVFAGEARKLEERLGDAALGKAFLLQGGDCAESFKEFTANNIRDTFRVLLQMGLVLTFGAQIPIIKISLTEFYFPINNRYMELAQRVDETLGFMAAAGLTLEHPIMTTTDFWTSHECLHLPYEQALTREDSTSGLYYDCSAHMLWVGERTRQLDGAHVEFLRGISNPIGIKVSDKMDPKELVKLCEILNPHNKPGRLTIINRMGAENMRVKLPHLIRAVRQARLIVTWVSDPMHGNTIKAPSGLKTRSFDAIRSELRAFFDVHEQEGSHPGGVHLEMTGQNVTECVGGARTVTLDDLSSRYHTHCDPRLNASQSLELAFAISERLRKRRIRSGRQVAPPSETLLK
ncbi:hypothetical protein IFM89_025158 [Coptis chinensis]|uniref:Phospho-2-dehydro-3-deoxyheptonate aldolase n=1 Tax=Coptis chinensis TaxID=261450 RepID=A0A835HS02_9MAGN|nr:hypothetical protein IFM89_025158 [Coptis chinensis]